ncbi:MAG: pilus assembly PilX family protein, partial [Halioglobus sp.]
MNRPARRQPARAPRQHGMALAVSLILLLVVTLIGLAAARGTTAQQRMSANFYDREIAFQNAEAGLREAANILPVIGTTARDCWSGTLVDGCPINPFAATTTNLQPTDIRTVAGSAYAKHANAAGAPQFVVEDMGEFPDPDTDTGFDQTANSFQYNAQGTTIQSRYYRITARSGDPATTVDRSTVTLQA